MKILKLSAIYVGLSLLWAAAAIVLAFYGWWLTPVASSDDADAFQQWVVGALQKKNRGSAAFVLIESGGVVEEYYQPEATINGNTLFPTASFSKFITALSVLSLAENGLIDLDAPVSTYLTRWQLPESSFDNDQVTVRRLLSHTAGLTDGLGFGDYGSQEALPTTAESLRSPRASSGTRVIQVGVEPGSEYVYSGGGYLVLQLLIEEVTGDSFSSHVAKAILEPVGMGRSTYAFYGDQPNATPSFASDGTVAPRYQYASPAATGFNSTANDLTRLVQMLVKGDAGIFSRRVMDSMREPHGYVMGAGIWGLGTILYAPSRSGGVVFGHDGGNEPALNATMRINPDTADAIVVLVSGHPSLATEIGAEWVLWQTGYPDALSTERTLSSARLPIGVGLGLLLILVVMIGRRTGGDQRKNA